MQTNDNLNEYRVLLVDDHPAIRQGLCFFLQAKGNFIVRETGTYTEALDIIEKEQFDIVILDLNLDEHSGLELIPKLEDKAISVLVYSMYEDVNSIDKAFQSGALGYVTKRDNTNFLLEAINTIVHGKRYISPYASASIEENGNKKVKIENALSLREQTVFALIGKGIGNAEIAKRLNITQGTVGTYITRIVLKLDIDNRRALRKYAVECSMEA